MAQIAQVPGVYRRKIGDIVVTALCDGALDADFGIFSNIDADAAEAIMAARFRPGPPVITVNCFAVETADRTILIDTGAGDNDMFDAGRLPRALAAAGISPDAVDLVLATHLHSDHAGGLATADGRAAFPNAELALHADEAKFWLESANPPDALASRFEAARASVAPYAARTRTFTGGEVAPGITAEPLPGHTPGHCGFLIASGADTLLMWTDVVHLPPLQTRRPDVGVAFDLDPEQARAQRKRLFDRVAADRTLIIGSHHDFPSFAHLERVGDAYALVPEVWHTSP